MYSCAFDLFEAAKAAAVEIRRVERMIAALRGAETSRGPGAPVSSGSVADPMARTDARMDYEAMWERRLAESRALVGYATSVLYGDGGAGGLASLADPVCADAIFWHYIMACPWRDVAGLVGLSASQARMKALTGLEIVDACGFDAAMRGEGMAEG